MKNTGNVRVEIFNMPFYLKMDGENNPEYLLSLADYVDKKMREVASGERANATNVAILAAMNIADEFHSYLNEKGIDDIEAMRTKALRVCEMVDDALTEPDV